MSATCTVDAIAKVLGLKPRRVQILAKQGIIPKAEHGKYDLPGCIIGYNKYVNDRASRENGDQKMNKAKLRLVEAQAAKAEMELRAFSKDYMPVTQVERDWSGMLLTFHARILSVPYRAATLLTGTKEFHEIEQVLTDLLHEALNELSSYDPHAVATVVEDTDTNQVAEVTAEAVETPTAATEATVIDAILKANATSETVSTSTSEE